MKPNTYKDQATKLYNYIEFVGSNNKETIIRVIEKDLEIAYLNGVADGMEKAKGIIWEK